MRPLPAAVEIRPPERADALYLAQHLRAADAAECRAAGLKGPREWRAALLDGMAQSPLCWTACVDRRPAAMFGCRPLLELGSAAPWFIGTDAVWQQRRAFVAQAPAYIDQMLALYPTLRNAVHADNLLAQRWLRAAGFALGEPHQVATGAWFIEFTREGA